MSPLVFLVFICPLAPVRSLYYLLCRSSSSIVPGISTVDNPMIQLNFACYFLLVEGVDWPVEDEWFRIVHVFLIYR